MVSVSLQHARCLLFPSLGHVKDDPRWGLVVVKMKRLAFTTIKTVLCTVCRWLLVEVTCVCNSGIVELLLVFIKYNQNHCVVFLVVFTLVHCVLLALAHDLWGSHWFQSAPSGSLKTCQRDSEAETNSTCSLPPLWAFLGDSLHGSQLAEPETVFYLSLNVVSVFLNHLRALWAAKLSEIIWTSVSFGQKSCYM